MKTPNKALYTLSVIALSTMFAAGCGNTNQTNSSAAKNTTNTTNTAQSQASKIQKNSVIGTAQLMLPNKGKCGVASLTFDRKAKTLNVAVDVQNLSPRTAYVIQITDSKASKVSYRFPALTTDKQGDAIAFHRFSMANTLSNTMHVQIMRSGTNHVMAEGAVKVTLTT